MALFGARLVGMRETQEMLRSPSSELRRRLGETLDAIGQKLEADAKRTCPVRDAWLTNSLTHGKRWDGAAWQGYVGSNLHYAKYIEYGTRRIAGGAVLAWKPGAPPITAWPTKTKRQTVPVRALRPGLGRGESSMPFLRPAIAANRDWIRERLSEAARRRSQ